MWLRSFLQASAIQYNVAAVGYCAFGCCYVFKVNEIIYADNDVEQHVHIARNDAVAHAVAAGGGVRLLLFLILLMA